jgi:hypothetical protein
MNKQGIRNQVKALMNRNDFTDALANTFIDQATARIQRTLRIPPMEKTEIYTVTESEPEVLVLPNDFLSIKFLYANSRLLECIDLGNYLALPESGGEPRVYTRVQAALKVKPFPAADTEITMIYYGEIPDLVQDSDTSWLSELAPDLLVYSALTFAADYFVDERKAAFEERFGSIYGELEEQSRILEMSQSALRVLPTSTEY